MEQKKDAQALVLANKELVFQNSEKKKRAWELDMANRQLGFLHAEKAMRAAELVIANKELLFQNREKENRASELAVANKKLVFQNAEKARRAAELVIANRELLYQNTEKEKRAEELTIANKELLFQNAEKAMRAAELVIANKELIFQNKEKEKRAVELGIANRELVFQNGEKEKRAVELSIANTELLFQNAEKEKRAAELVMANEALLFQNIEKEKLTAELLVANNTLAFENAEKEKRAAELEAVNKELESFSYSVSHDLRAPLRAINGFTQVMIEDYMEQLNDEAKAVLDEIIVNSDKMGQLIDNLLEFSRVGKQHISKSMVNIGQLVNTVITELTFADPLRKVVITVKNLENISCDRNMLKLVFINLLSNAVKYSGRKKEPVIEIGCYRENEYCTYYVKDNGAGFDMRYYDKLFGVFQRLHSSNEFEGTGVGLAIIQKIVTKHEGKVWAEGKVDEGACFYISLPCTE